MRVVARWRAQSETTEASKRLTRARARRLTHFVRAAFLTLRRPSVDTVAASARKQVAPRVCAMAPARASPTANTTATAARFCCHQLWHRWQNNTHTHTRARARARSRVYDNRLWPGQSPSPASSSSSLSSPVAARDVNRPANRAADQRR